MQKKLIGFVNMHLRQVPIVRCIATAWVRTPWDRSAINTHGILCGPQLFEL